MKGLACSAARKQSWMGLANSIFIKGDTGVKSKILLSDCFSLLLKAHYRLTKLINWNDFGCSEWIGAFVETAQN